MHLTELKNRFKYVVLVYGPILVSLLWLRSWRVTMVLLGFAMGIEISHKLFTLNNVNVFAATAALGLGVIIAIGLWSSTYVRDGPQGWLAVLIIATPVFAADVFAYFGGKLSGKQGSRLAVVRALSPNKTDEGFICGYIGGAWATVALYVMADDVIGVPFTPSEVYRIAMFLPAVAIIGDLFESGIKRWLDIKDFSKVLGSHGGFTDRFDAMGFSLLFYFLFKEVLFSA